MKNINGMRNIVVSGVLAVAGVFAAPVIGIGLGEGVINLPMVFCWILATGLNAYAAVRTYELR